MSSHFKELLKPEIINVISGLELIARTVADGHVHGLNKSMILGTGGEFSQYRSYEPGDDLRLIDWKAYGRSERYYTKLAEEETNIKVKFVLDASNSMNHSYNGIKKIEYAKIVIAALGYISFHQGDAIGVTSINDVRWNSYPTRVQKLFSNFLHQLIDVEALGKWPITFDNLESLHRPNEKALIIVISDLFQEQNEIVNVVKQLKTGLNEVIFLQILGKDELEFNYKGVLSFEDLETGKLVKVDTKEIKKDYLINMQHYLDKTKEELLDLGVSWEKFVVGESLSETLTTFIKQRKQLM